MVPRSEGGLGKRSSPPRQRRPWRFSCAGFQMALKRYCLEEEAATETPSYPSGFRVPVAQCTQGSGVKHRAASAQLRELREKILHNSDLQLSPDEREK